MNRGGLMCFALVFASITSVAGLIAWAAYSESVSLLAASGSARWITYPRLNSLKAKPSIPITTVFEKSVVLPTIRERCILQVRAFRTCEIRVNHQIVEVSDRPVHWKQTSEVDVTHLLREGENQVQVSVTNQSGPPAFWIMGINGSGIFLTSGGDWDSSIAGATNQPAELAEHVQPYRLLDPSRRAERVGECILSIWWVWVVFSAGLAVILRVIRHRHQRMPLDAQARERTIAEAGILVTVAVMWGAMILWNSGNLPWYFGYDAIGHIEYINFVRDHWTIPFANQGAQMYHPPLYYVLAAFILSMAGTVADSLSGTLLIRSLNFLLMMITLAATYGTLRIVFKNRVAPRLIGVLYMAFQPMNLFLYQYPTNEVLAATLTYVSCYLLTRILDEPSPSLTLLAGLGGTLGLGLLSKISVVLFIPPVFAAICLKAIHHRSLWVRLPIVVLTPMLLSGWYYWRVWQHFGSPLISNNDLRVKGEWWQSPGYITPESFFRFGESLRSPLYCYWNSLWDGLFASMWTDSGCGGALWIESRSPWNYQAMIGGIALSLLISVVILRGILIVCWRFCRRPSITATFWLSWCAISVLWLISFNIKYPYSSVVKAFYILPVQLAVAMSFAVGMELSGPRMRRFQDGMYVLLGLWCLNSYATYLISPWDPAVRLRQIKELNASLEQLRQLEQLVRDCPKARSAQNELASYYLRNRQFKEAEVLIAKMPEDGEKHYLLARMHHAQRRGEQVLHDLQTAIRLNPWDFDLALAYYEFLENQGDKADSAEQISACRNLLRIDPYSIKAHELLAGLYERQGDLNRAALHQQYYQKFQVRQ